MENSQAFDVLNGPTPDLSNDNSPYLLNDDNKILSLDNPQGLMTPSHPQYRPNSSSGGTTPTGSSNRIRRNGSMRRSLLFVSGSGMQIPSPSPTATPPNKSPYMNNRLTQSNDVLSSSQRRDNLVLSARDRASSMGRTRAYSQSNDELYSEEEKSPEQTNIQLSEHTQHPLIVTKNSSNSGSRYITPTPINATDLTENKPTASSPMVSGNSEKKHARRTSSFSNRSLLMTPNSSAANTGNNSVKKNTDFQSINIFETSNEDIHDSENTLKDGFKANESVDKDNDIVTPKQTEEDPSEKLFSKLAFKEAQLLESKSALEDLKKKVKLQEEQIKQEEFELEELKQEMAAELLKKHQRVPPQSTSKMSDLLGMTKKSVQTVVPPTPQPSEIMETSFTEELTFPTHAQQSFSNEKKISTDFHDKPGNGLFGNTHNGSYDSDGDLDDVIYSLNSPQKKPVEKFDDVDDDLKENEDSSLNEMLDENFPLKENTQVITPAAKHKASQSVSVANDLTKKRDMPQRSKSRMSMYFSKTVSLMSQFDQILQSELEKKLGVEEEVEEEDEEIMDLPPRPDEIDNVQQEAPKKAHGRSLSSYRFFG